MGALARGVGDHAVNSHRSKNQREQTESSDERAGDALAGAGHLHARFQRGFFVHRQIGIQFVHRFFHGGGVGERITGDARVNGYALGIILQDRQINERQRVFAE